MALKLLVNPLATGAYHADVLAVAEAELRRILPDATVTVDARAALTFLDVDVEPEAAPALAGLSFVQGVFVPTSSGMEVLDADPGHALPADLVFGAKYRGKTHELVTLLALNVARATCRAEPTRVLDPMAGRGTTLLWAARLGLDSIGVEQDPKALEDLQRHVKRQTKLHRLKHKESRGSVGPKTKGGAGRFLAYRLGNVDLKLVTGDSRDLPRWVGPRPFPLIVTDLPYGIQHTGPSGTRDPSEVLRACAPGWSRALAPGGAMVLVFNRLLPSKEALAGWFEAEGLERVPFDVPHRMSESIVRDLLVLRQPDR